jgi:hypothetical protein
MRAMSDVAPGTLVQMRTTRRFSHYLAGEVIAVPFAAARDLHAKRLAEPLHLLVPTAAAAAPDDTPQRQAPATVVRK